MEQILKKYKFDTKYYGPKGNSYYYGEEECLPDDNCTYHYCNELDSNVINKISDAVKPLTSSFELNVSSGIQPPSFMLIKVMFDKDVVECYYGSSSKLQFIENLYPFCTPTFNYAVKLLIFSNNTIYREIKNKSENKLVPLSFSQINEYAMENKFFKDFFIFILRCMGYEYKIYDRISTYYEKDSYFIPPVTFNEVRNYNDFTELFLEKYKIAKTIDCLHWEKDVNISYLILKAWNYVLPEQRNKLLQITEIDSSLYINQPLKGRITLFLLHYIDEQIHKYDEDYYKYSSMDFIKDYIEICYITKTKVNINFRSMKKLINAHDEISQKWYMKKTPLVKIKKDTRFKKLRSILPEEFEWIKTRVRLCNETRMQHHCVWSYADKINKDVCQIYSYVDRNGDRFTLEFRISRGKYVLRQVQGKYNKPDTNHIRKLVEDILKTSNGI